MYAASEHPRTLELRVNTESGTPVLEQKWECRSNFTFYHFEWRPVPTVSEAVRESVPTGSDIVYD